MSKLSLSLAILVLLAAYPSAAIVPTNERPLADAGLDQQVRKGATVLLDGSGSHDPDGTIANYEWTIETPGGATISPDDQNGGRAEFEPDELGRYEVTLTVIDDDGATSSDTLYVTVSPGRAPQLELSGPTSREVGDRAQYTARIEAGDADLDHVTWTVDGTVIANRTLSGQRATVRITRIFPRSGTRRVRAIAYDTDGQRGSETVSLDVSSGTSTGSPSTGPSRTRSIAQTAAPMIDGPRLVTGTRPLTGTYSLRTSVASGRIDSVSWRTLSTTEGRGFGTSIDWEPGEHRLFAVVEYEDGSSDVAHFPDGGMVVRADPKPEIRAGEIDDYGGISGSPVATDGYGNLRSLRVKFGGKVVAERTIEPAASHANGRSLERPFEYTDVEFGRTREVTIVATDMRGQTTTEKVRVDPVGQPEIVRSEFVNGPVDSYHRRINASRYAAHHVLKIRLNGVDPEDISTNVWANDPGHTRQLSGYRSAGRVYYYGNDTVIVDTYWAGNVRYRQSVVARWKVITDNEKVRWTGENTVNFEVEASDPELRYEVIRDGTRHDKTEWGIVVDASRSFDPDHTQLKYIWSGGAQPITRDNATAKFNALASGNLKIRDGSGAVTTNHYNFLNTFNPGIERVETVSGGPYKPNETVRFRVQTSPYKLTKNRYEISLGVGVEDAEYEVVDWEVTRVGEDCQIGDCGLERIEPWMRDIDNHRFSFYEGVIDVPASELSDGATDPKLVLYNDGKPDQTRLTRELPETDVLTKGSRVWENVSVNDLEYTVKRPVFKSAVLRDEQTHDEYLRDGYRIADTETGTKYVLEKYVNIRDAKYETREQSFRRSQLRSVFLQNHPEWTTAGSYVTTNTWNTTESEWRDSKSGKGRFTGETRRKKTDDADYRTERQYEYEYDVERTGTRTVRRRKRIPVRRTRTYTVTKCNHYFGCYQTTESESYWTTETHYYTTTETYTYTVERTDTYWAVGRWLPDHRATGRTRTIKTDGADYTTQYEYEYEVAHSETIRHYQTTRRVKVRDAQYGWKPRDETSNEAIATSIVRRSSQWRIGDRIPIPIWTLKKRVGTVRRTVSSYEDASNVIKTRATVSGDVKQRYLDTETGTTIIEPIGHAQRRYRADRAETKREIRTHFGTPTNSDRLSDSELKNKLLNGSA